MNGRIGRDVDGVHGGNRLGDRNSEGEAILEFATCFDLVVVNTFFKKEMQKLVTYESGEVKTVVKLVVIDMSIKRSTKEKAKGMRGRLKTWKLRSAAGREEFECEVGKIMVQGESAQERWNSLEHSLMEAKEKECGWSKG